MTIDTHTPARKSSIDVRPEEQSPADKYDWITEAFATHPRPVEHRCGCHEEQRWWRSVSGDHLVCGICHPPAVPEVVKEWCKNGENAKSGEIAVKHKKAGCTSTRAWLHVLGTWHCADCQPCADEKMKVDEREATKA